MKYPKAFPFIVAFIVFAIVQTSLSVAKADTNACSTLFFADKVDIYNLKVTKEDGNVDVELAGFTKEGVEKLLLEQSKLRNIYEVTERNYFNLESIIHLYNVARTGAWHILAFGEPGGAKTELFEFMQQSLWYKQIHALTAEIEVLGGLTEEGIKNGQAIRNLRNTLGTAVFAFLDELEKANPALLSTLLRLLNERKVDSLEAPLRTLVAATNASMGQIIWNFILTGNGSTGPAFLNRFHFKARIANVLPKVLQGRLEDLKREKRRLKALSEQVPEVLDNQAFEFPAQNPDWETLKNLSNVIFDFDSAAHLDLMDMAEQLREKLATYTKKSEEKMKNQELEMQYYQSAELSTRLRTMLEEVIRVSALLDLMRSDNFNKKYISSLNGPIKLTSLSLWRAYSVFTSTGMGETFFDLDRKEMIWGAVRVDGELLREIDDDEKYLEQDGDYVVNSLVNEKNFVASNKQEEEVEHLLEERKMFSETLENILERMADTFASIQKARNANKNTKAQSVDFESFVEDVYQ